MIAAFRQNHAVDYAVVGVATFGITVPTFVVAPVLQIVFGLMLAWLPVGGWNDGAMRNTIMPILTLALPQIAVVARMTRAAMIEVLRSNHIRTLRANGLPLGVIVRHALRGAALAGRVLSRPGRRGAADGLGRRGDDLRHPRSGPLLRRRRAQPRLHARHGHRRS